jgi:hypothetical protein
MSMPLLTLRLGSLSIDAPKRKAAFDPKRSGHYGLPNDSATSLALVALSRIAQARDDAILNAAATAPVGALLVSALRSAVHRLARDGGATSAFTDATANAFLQTAASTIAMQRRYAQAGLTLPSALPATATNEAWISGEARSAQEASRTAASRTNPRAPPASTHLGPRRGLAGEPTWCASLPSWPGRARRRCCEQPRDLPRRPPSLPSQLGL